MRDELDARIWNEGHQDFSDSLHKRLGGLRHSLGRVGGTIPQMLLEGALTAILVGTMLASLAPVH